MEINKISQEITLSQDQLISILNILISINPNNKEIKQANEILNKYSKNILSIETYLYLIKYNENFKIRQLCAILLLKRLEKHWPNLSVEIKSSFQNLILEIYLYEKNYLVLKAIGEIIYRIMKLLLANNDNTTLFVDLIIRDPLSYQVEEINIFEVNLYIISELIENNFIYVKEKINEIKIIISNSLKLGSNKMKENASKCLGNLLKTCKKNKSNFDLFNDLIPFFIDELRNFSEETIKHIFENLCELNKDSFVNLENYFDILLSLTIEFLTNEDISNDSKLIISEFLIMFAENNKLSFKKNNSENIYKVMKIAYIFASSEDEYLNENENLILEKEYPLYDIGERIIESFSLIFESSIIFNACVEFSKDYLNSKDSNKIKAALISLGLISEGCAQMLKKNLGEILNLIVSKFLEENSEEIIIKSACIIAIDKLTEFCWPNILNFHDKIIPMLLVGITPHSNFKNEKNLQNIINKSLICLQYFCKNTNDDINLNIYLNELLPKLIFLLRSKSILIQKNSLSALGAILENANDLSSEIIHQILETCKFIIENNINTLNNNNNYNNEEDIEIKACALECVSHVAFSTKLINFGYLIQFFTEFAFNCIKSNIYEMQDAGFVFLGSLARTIGPLFASELNNFMNIVYNVLKDESGSSNNKGNDEFGMDSDSEDEVEENGKSIFT